MTKTAILRTILIISFISGIYFLITIFNSSNYFKKDFNEFKTPSELKIELEKGVYDLFELSTKQDGLKKSDINYLVTQIEENPKIIEINLDTTGSRNKPKTTITYTIFDKVYKSFGQFEIDKKQYVKIISTINNTQIDKLAYRSKETSKSIFGVIKSSLLLLLSILGFLISGIILLIARKKK